MPAPDTLLAVLEDARTLGFLGDAPASTHLGHALAMGRLLPEAPRQFLDLGAGGGVPGLVLAVLFPDAQGVLLDAMHRRCIFLGQAIDRLRLNGRITVVESRAEVAGRQVAHRERCDVVTARSFATPAVTAECASAFLAPRGVLAVSEPPQGDSSRWPEAPLSVLGLGPAVHRDDKTCHVVLIRKLRPLDERWPRRTGVPSRRPLW